MSDTGWSEPDADGISVRAETHNWVRLAETLPPPEPTAKRYYLNRMIPGENEWTPLGYITKDSDGPILDGTPLPEVESSGPRFPEGENPDA